MGAVIRFPKGETAPEDLMWAVPGAPSIAARQVQQFEPAPRHDFFVLPAGGDLPPRGLPSWLVYAALLIIGIEIGFIIGCYVALFVMTEAV